MEDDMLAYFKEAHEYLEKAIEHLHKELVKVRTGKASPSMLDGIFVDYYGTQTPINQVANIMITDSKTLTIQPWEKSMLSNIEQAIFASNIGLTPMNDGENIRIVMPPLTEERRKDLVKQIKHHGEETKVSIRHARHKVMDYIKNAVKDGYPEDGGKRKEAKIEATIKEYSEKVDQLVEAKEIDIMTI